MIGTGDRSVPCPEGSAKLTDSGLGHAARAASTFLANIDTDKEML